MAFPDNLLADGERVEFNLRPHAKALVTPLVIVLAVVGLGSYAIAAMPDGQFQTDGRWAVTVVGLLLLGFYAVRPALRWRTTRLVVTDRRVLVRTGVIARTGRDIPLSRINDITFTSTLLERVFGCGTLVVESAGERGQVVLPEVPRVETVQRRLSQLVEDATRG